VEKEWDGTNAGKDLKIQLKKDSRAAEQEDLIADLV